MIKTFFRKRVVTLFGICHTFLITLQAQAPAFPGAEGHGRYVTGGRGGEVIHVTNLNDSGEGSLRAAVKGNRKKIIIFDVAGVIPLQSDLTIGANTTVLGQTAPYPGITLRYYTIRPTSNSILRFLRFRRGQERDVNDGADAIWNNHQTGLIIDHCSISWSIDELASFYDNNNFTMQWCMLGESLINSGHDKGAHGYGGIWGGKLASFHHNYLGSVDNRAPRFNGARYQWDGYTQNKYYGTYGWNNTVEAENVDFRNCVLYNWGSGNGCYGGPGGGQVNIVNNYYQAGPATKNTKRVTEVSVGTAANSTPANMINMTSRYYIAGNYVTAAGQEAENYDWKGVSYDKGVKTFGTSYYTPSNGYYDHAVERRTEKDVTYVPIKLAQPIVTGDITTHSAQQAYQQVLAYAGASFYRDDVDVRYVKECREGNTTFEGSITHRPGMIDRVADVDGYSEKNFPTGSRAANFDSDNDGIPDAWEQANGLNPADPNDAKSFTLDPKGYYMNIEVYANSLVESLVKAENSSAQQAFEEYFPPVKEANGIDYYPGRNVKRIEPEVPPTIEAQERQLYHTDFQDWQAVKSTNDATVVTQTTRYSHEPLSFTIVNSEVTPTNKNLAKFPTWQGGYIMAAKAANASIVTSTLGHISKVQFKHGATGSKRGWRLEVKGEQDNAWTLLSETPANPTSGSDVEVNVNKSNCQLRFTNLTTNQNAYLFELSIYGNVKKAATPMLAEFSVGDQVFTADDVFEEQSDGTYAATIELSRKYVLPSENNPLKSLKATNGIVQSTEYRATADGVDITVKVVQGAEARLFLLHIKHKPLFNITYIDDKGKTLGVQQVEKDSPITQFSFGQTSLKLAANEVFRGWFTAREGVANRKISAQDPIQSDLYLYAIVTPKEIASNDARYDFMLTSPFFYDEDHEAFDSHGSGKFHDNVHGWSFHKGDRIDLLVGPHAYILLKGCIYSVGIIQVVNSKQEVLTTFDAKTAHDGDVLAYEYKGKADKLSLIFDHPCYLHQVTIANMTTNPVELNDAGYYEVKAGDAAHLLNTLMVANVKASTQSITKIFIPKGVYDLKETVLTPISGDNISLIGEDMEETIIKNAPPMANEGIATTATLLLTGNNTYLQDLTIQNALDYYGCGSAGRAVVLQDKGNHTICKNVKLLSFQDTYYSNANGQYYFEDSEIHGTVDYLCGGGDVVFNRVNFVNEPRSKDGKGQDVIAAPYPSDDVLYGYVMLDCNIINNNQGGYSLGRSWGGKSKLAWIRTTMNEQPVQDGTHIQRFTLAGMNAAAYQFKEYQSKNIEGNLLTPQSNRVTFVHLTGNYTYDTTLKEVEVEGFQLVKMFEKWMPNEIAAQRQASYFKLSGTTLRWDVDGKNSSKPVFAIYEDGKLLTITHDLSMTVPMDKQHTYTLRTANERGGFGKPMPVEVTTGIRDNKTNGTDEISQELYTINGTKAQGSQKGVVIVVKKKRSGEKNAYKTWVR